MTTVKINTVFLHGSCPICYEEFDKGSLLSCGHVFHENCIQLWLQKKKKCPVCRGNPQEEKKAKATPCGGYLSMKEFAGLESRDDPVDLNFELDPVLLASRTATTMEDILRLLSR